MRAFLRGHRFAGERRLLRVEVRRLQEPRVGRYRIAGREMNDIAWNEAAALDLHPAAVAPDGRGRSQLRLQLSHRAFGAECLPVVERDAENDDGGDDRRIGGLAE